MPEPRETAGADLSYFFAKSALGDLTASLAESGTDHLDLLVRVYKDRAKTLGRSLRHQESSPRLMAVQEALAHALGFSNTHGLQQAMVALREALRRRDAAEREDWVELNEALVVALVPLHRLQDEFYGGLPLAEAPAEYLTRLAASLARHLTLPIPAVQNAIARAWAQEKDWSRLSTRTPLNSKIDSPLVTFEVEGDPKRRTSVGYFYESQEAHWLRDHILVLDDEFEEELTLDDIQEIVNGAKAVARKHPEFLLAGVTASTLMDRYMDELGYSWNEVLELVEQGLKHTEALMPLGFKGTLDLSHVGNEPYLRSLSRKMTLALQTTGGGKQALACANKYLRLCPTAQNVVSNRLPLLLACYSRNEKALRLAIGRALESGDAAGLLNAGLAQVLTGDATEGARNFIESVMRAPQLGACLLDNESLRPRRRELNYGYEHAFDSDFDPFEASLAALHVQAEIVSLETWTTQVLSDRLLLETEDRLKKRYGRTLLPSPEWPGVAKEQARRLAPLLLKRYPADALRWTGGPVPSPAGSNPAPGAGPC